MLTRRKLLSLSPETRRRKLVRLLHGWETELTGGGKPPSFKAILDLLSVLEEENASPEILSAYKTVLKTADIDTGPGADAGGAVSGTIVWDLRRLRGCLEDELGIDFADWDLTLPGSRELNPDTRNILPLSLYLDGIRSPFNIGSIFRTAECFGAGKILLSPESALPTHPRALRSSMGSTKIVPWQTADYQAVEDCEDVFILELGGTPLDEFIFPPAGLCVIGSEELGVHPHLRQIAKKKRGIVSIPLFGSKASLNVSVAFGILMNAWSASVRDS